MASEQQELDEEEWAEQEAEDTTSRANQSHQDVDKDTEVSGDDDHDRQDENGDESDDPSDAQKQHSARRDKAKTKKTKRQATSTARLENDHRDGQWRSRKRARRWTKEVGISHDVQALDTRCHAVGVAWALPPSR